MLVSAGDSLLLQNMERTRESDVIMLGRRAGRSSCIAVVTFEVSTGATGISFDLGSVTATLSDCVACADDSLTIGCSIATAGCVAGDDLDCKDSGCDSLTAIAVFFESSARSCVDSKRAECIL